MKSVVLLSSGLDSTVNLYQAHKNGEVILALTFDYGQKACQREIESAKKITRSLNISHQVISLPFFKDFTMSSLINSRAEVPSGTNVSIDSREKSIETAKSVWVPNRNGIFLNIAAGIAENLGADTIIPGFNLEEASTFPDNTQEFLVALTKSFYYSTQNRIQATCFTTQMNKTEIVRLGQTLNVDWNLIWPCYLDHEKWCGQCESCQRSKRAFLQAGIDIQKNFVN